MLTIKLKMKRIKSTNEIVSFQINASNNENQDFCFQKDGVEVLSHILPLSTAENMGIILFIKQR